MKHTPGPWKAFRAQGTACIADTRELTCLEDVHTSLVIEIINGENVEADAYLIAAAPDMLEALQNLDRYFSQPGEDDWIRFEKKVLRPARAAINKARGEVSDGK